MARSTSADQHTNGVNPPSTNQSGNDLKFETALSELEKIVANMEAGNLSLEDSITAYRRGSELLKHCQQQLNDAEQKIQVLENGVLRDFDTAVGGNL